MTTQDTSALKTQGGMQLFPHHIQVPGNSKIGTRNLTIREQPMRAYAEFVKLWGVGIGAASEHPDSSFSQLWISNSSFRDAMSQACNALGIDDPDSILPTHLQELLMICVVDGQPDIRPALFRLHNDAPDPKAMGQMIAPTQKSTKPLKSPSRSLWSTLFQ